MMTISGLRGAGAPLALALLAAGAAPAFAAPRPGTAAEAPALLEEEAPPRGAARQFKTDFSRHTVPYAEVLSGGPPKDGIPALDDPRFISVAAAAEWLEDREPVVLVEAGGAAKAYPLQVLTWHEIVNDEVGGVPLTVTFCPLCNTAIGFKREFDSQVLDFGTTGRLRYSNLIMYDRQTETWWQQATGEAIAGRYAGSRLEFHPANIVSWEEFRTGYPRAEVLSRDTGYRRAYGRNPYAGYDDVNNTPFLYRGPPTPEALPAMARVLTVDLEEETAAYPYTELAAHVVINDTVAGQALALFWQAGTASALDSANLAAGRDVGSGAAFSRELEGQILEFELRAGVIRDRQTESSWNLFGAATAGPLQGSRLRPVVSVNHFWFSWAAFRPETRVFTTP